MDRRAAANMADVLENGPGLRYCRSTWVGAIRIRNGVEEVLTCGLGGMGVGTMWGPANDEDRRDPRYALCKDGWYFSFWNGWRKPLVDIGKFFIDDRDLMKDPPTKEEAVVVMSAYLRSVVGPNKEWEIHLINPTIVEEEVA